jgi:hypothetical protein
MRWSTRSRVAAADVIELIDEQDRPRRDRVAQAVTPFGTGSRQPRTAAPNVAVCATFLRNPALVARWQLLKYAIATFLGSACSTTRYRSMPRGLST